MPMARILNARLLVFALFGIILAILIYANVQAQENVQEKALEPGWFTYELDDNSGINEAHNYSFLGGQDTDPGCQGQGLRCAVLAMPDASNPDQPDLTTVEQIRQKAP